MTQEEIKQAINDACDKYDFETVSTLIKSLDKHKCACGKSIDWLRVVQNKTTCIDCGYLARRGIACMPEQKRYQHIQDLQQAIQIGEIKVTDITGFDCKHELFINDQAGRTVFSAYYGTSNGCADVCALLGIGLEEA